MLAGWHSLRRLDVVLAKLEQRLDGDKVGEGIGLVDGDQLLPLPAAELALGEAKLTADVRA